jgi:hypothetical protein
MVKTDSRVFQVTKVTGDDESSEMVEIRERSLTLVQATSLLLGKETPPQNSSIRSRLT